jgi:hypothetical protein
MVATSAATSARGAGLSSLGRPVHQPPYQRITLRTMNSASSYTGCSQGESVAGGSTERTMSTWGGEPASRAAMV